MINVLIPLIRAQFGASTAEVGWVVTGYALAYAIGVPLYGRISDFFGVRGYSPSASRVSPWGV
jgi:MFS family permease